MILRANRLNTFREGDSNVLLLSPLYVWLKIQGLTSVVGVSRDGREAKPHPSTRIGFNFPLAILWVEKHVDENTVYFDVDSDGGNKRNPPLEATKGQEKRGFRNSAPGEKR